jgi:aminoglycoside phosphotransferase (APT) family kinase protein
LAALKRYWPESLAVHGVRAISGGASQEIWTFDVDLPDRCVGLILRRTRHWSESGQAGSAGMAAEAALLQVAAGGGVPVPIAVGTLRPGDALGDGYFMHRVEGETSARKILRHPDFEGARERLAEDCGALMARIHALPRGDLPTLRKGGAAQERSHWLAAHRSNGTARPVFELALRWLAEHEPAPADDVVLVHGDFRNGNLVVGPEGVRAVLDWELAHLGDPMEDLGWFCVNSWRFGNVALPAGGLGTRAQLFRGYEAEGGRPVDGARVHWWQVLGSLKWGVTCDAMGLAWRSGADRSIERLAIARRASEAEADLLALLAPRAQAFKEAP